MNDTISRRAAVEKLEAMARDYGENGAGLAQVIMYRASDAIERLPAEIDVTLSGKCGSCAKAEKIPPGVMGRSRCFVHCTERDMVKNRTTKACKAYVEV